MGWWRSAVPLGSVSAATALAAGVFVVFVVMRRALSSDAFLDAYAGRLIAHHGIPHHNTLTAVGAGRTWVDQQWLGQLLLYGANWLAGWPGAVAVCAGAVALTAAISYRLLRQRLPALLALEATILVLTAIASNTAVRAQTLCYPLWCLVLWVVIAQPERLSGRRALGIFALLVVWANLHGSILLAAATVAAASVLHAYRSRHALRRRWTLLATGALLAPIATPYGVAIFGYYRSVLGNSTMQTYSSEWRHPGLNLASFGFLVTLAAATVLAIRYRRRWRCMLSPATILALAIAVLALHSIRFGAWFGLPAALAFAGVAGTPQPRARDRAPTWIATASLTGALLAAALLATSGSASFQAFAPPRLLARAHAALDSHPGSTLLGDSTMAPAMLWAYPDSAGRVLYDSRFELYTPTEMRRYATALQGRLDATARLPRCIVIAAGAGSGLVDDLHRRHDLDLIEDAPEGVIALTPACR